ncbi:MAG: DUF1289 domain-containing protein [Sphingorhabdus sp.]
MNEIASPCINICKLDQSNRWCVGCGRSLDEIAIWPEASNEKRQAILDELPGRTRHVDDAGPV